MTKFDIQIEPTDEVGTEFHTLNDASGELKRTQIGLSRRDNPRISVSNVDVIHGLLSPDDEAFGTLWVMRIHLGQDVGPQMAREFRIRLQFSSLEPDGPSPEVVKIAPEGQFIAKAIGGSAGGFPEHPWIWKKHLKGEVDAVIPIDMLVTGADGAEPGDGSVLIGRRRIIGRDWGGPNSAEWVIEEDSSRRSGLPADVTVAVLLKREDEDLFTATIALEAYMDYRGMLTKFYGSNSRDDPIQFDPQLEPTNIEKYQENLDRLDDLDLEALVGCAPTLSSSAPSKGP